MTDAASRGSPDGATRVVACLIALAACASERRAPTAVPPTTAPATPPTVRAIAGGDLRDTVQAQPPQALVVEVRGADGLPARGVAVRFESPPPEDLARPAERDVYVCRITSPTCEEASSVLAVDSTNADGRASAILRFGAVSRRTNVWVRVPTLGLVTTSTHEVLPGDAARLRVATRDTAIVLGRSLALDPSVTDRLGNVRPDTLSLGATTTAIELDARGRVTGREVGRAAVVVRAGGFVDSVQVAVLPSGRLVGFVRSDSVGAGAFASIATLGFDGSAPRVLASGIGNALGTFPVWSPEGGAVAFHGGDFVSREFVMVVDTSGRTVPRRIGSGDAVRTLHARFAGDGQAVLCVGVLGDGSAYLWTGQVDGPWARSQRAIPNLLPVRGAADVAPWESQVAYVGPGGVRVFTAPDGAVGEVIAPGAVSRRWSADGLIAFVTPTAGSREGPIGVVASDGSGRRDVTTERYYPGVGWSPDRRWLVAQHVDGRLRIVRVSDGLTIRLPIPYAVAEPSWR